MPAVLCVWLLACASANPPWDEARRHVRDGDHAAAIDRLEEALRIEPGNTRIRAELIRQRELEATRLYARIDERLRQGDTAQAHMLAESLIRLDPAGPRARQVQDTVALALKADTLVRQARAALTEKRYGSAQQLARQALEFSQAHVEARRLMLEAQRLQERADAEAHASRQRKPAERPITLEFREAPLRSVFEALARVASVNFVFDKDVRTDAKVTVMLRDMTLDEAVRVLLQTQGLDRRRLNDTSFLIFPATSQKNREHQELVTRAFYLSNIEAKQAQALVRAVVKSKDVFTDDRLNLMVIKDTPEAVRLAEKLMASVDVAEPEVVLDVEILEVTNNRLQELGLRFPNQVSFGLVGSSAGTTGTTSVVSESNFGQQVAYIANPSLVLNMRATDGRSNLLSNPSIRVRNRDKARIHIGEKVPQITSNFTGTTTGTANTFSTAVNYIDVGLKLDVEPQIYVENEVAIKLGLEVSSITEEVRAANGTVAYRIGTRNTGTTLRLRDGETQILAGLIRDEERTSGERVPLLGRLPVIGRLFGSQLDRREKSEIVLLITPRIVRSLDRPMEALGDQSAGTEAAVGAAPLRLTGRASVAMAPGSGTPGRAQPVAVPLADPPAAARSGDATETATAQISLQAPAQAAPGEEFVLVVRAEGVGLATAGSVDLFLDGAFTGGAVTVALKSGDGGRLSGEVRVRVAPGASGVGTINVANVNLPSADGRGDAKVSLPAPASVTIQPRAPGAS